MNDRPELHLSSFRSSGLEDTKKHNVIIKKTLARSGVLGPSLGKGRIQGLDRRKYFAGQLCDSRCLCKNTPMSRSICYRFSIFLGSERPFAGEAFEGRALYHTARVSLEEVKSSTLLTKKMDNEPSRCP